MWLGIRDFWSRSGASSVMIARAAEWNLSVFRYIIVHYSTVQFTTVPYSTVLYSIIQYGTHCAPERPSGFTERHGKK